MTSVVAPSTADKPSFERRFISLQLSASLPSAIGLILLMIYNNQLVYLTANVRLILLFTISYCAFTLTNSNNYAFRTLSNLPIYSKP